METFAILCTGPSMSQDVADSVRHLRVIAVNGSYVFAPWAEALVANDGNWWRCNPEAMDFEGRKFSTSQSPGLERLNPNGVIGSSCCSGVVALEVAKVLAGKQFKPAKILLLGVDFKGSHFFGDYTGKCRNTDPKRRQVHAKQFRSWRDGNAGIPVFNCTPGSALDCFPKVPLEELIEVFS